MSELILVTRAPHCECGALNIVNVGSVGKNVPD